MRKSTDEKSSGNVKKWRRILHAILILAAFIAYVIWVGQHFHFGLFADTEEEMYFKMSGEPVFLDLEPCDVLITNVVWKEEMLFVDAEFYTAELTVEDLRLGLYGYDGRLMMNSKAALNINLDENLSVSEQRWHYYKPTEEIVLDVFGEKVTIAMEPITDGTVIRALQKK